MTITEIKQAMIAIALGLIIVFAFMHFVEASGVSIEEQIEQRAAVVCSYERCRRDHRQGLYRIYAACVSIKSSVLERRCLDRHEFK